MADQIKLPSNAALVDESGLPVRVWHRFFTLLATRCGIIEGSTSATATAGAAAAIPANPVGYLTITVDGRNYKVPYYNV